MQWLHDKMLDMIQNYLWRRDPDFAQHDLTKTAELLDWYAIAMRAHAQGNVVAADVALSKAAELCHAYEESFAALQDGAVLASAAPALPTAPTPAPMCRSAPHADISEILDELDPGADGFDYDKV